MNFITAILAGSLYPYFKLWIISPCRSVLMHIMWPAWLFTIFVFEFIGQLFLLCSSLYIYVYLMHFPPSGIDWRGWLMVIKICDLRVRSHFKSVKWRICFEDCAKAHCCTDVLVWWELFRIGLLKFQQFCKIADLSV